jgi:hypothetical protein
LLGFFFVGCLFLVMFFHQGLSSNPTSRLLTVLALVEDHRLYADRWADQTIDKAIVRGHIYSDKAPLASFVSVPLYAAWRATHRKAGETAYEDAAVHLSDLVAAAVPFAIFALLLFHQAARFLDDARAIVIALVTAFSTCLVNYGNVFFGHMMAAALIVGSYALAKERRRLLLAGLIGGCSVLTEYPAVLTQAILAVWLLGHRAREWRDSLRYCAGALGPAIALFAYNAWITHNPFSFPYAHVTDQWEAMRTAFGVRLPSFEAAWELVFGEYRGMLFYAPTLAVLGPIALYRPAPPGRTRGETQGLLAVLCGTQFVFVCSYFKWDGGWCTGPRHLAPVIALLAYEGVAQLAAHWPRFRVLFFLTGLMGIVVNICAASTFPITSESHTHPMFDEFWPAILENRINGHNIAAEVGLHNGRWLLVAWAVLFVVFGVLLILLARQPPHPRRQRAASPSAA